MKRDNLKGRRFGRLLVIALASEDPTKWLCLCDCGNETMVMPSNLKRLSRSTRSCGCLSKEITKLGRSRKHGKKNSRIYNIWRSMIDRCTNANHPGYANYGGRGISVSEDWKTSFSAFYRDVGDPPSGLTLDRVDNSKGYCKSNFRWATWREQENNRRNTRFLTFGGTTKPLSHWAESLGISYYALHRRLKFHSVKEALTMPKGNNTKYA